MTVDEYREENIPYEIHSSVRARHIRLTVDRGSRVVLTVPQRVSLDLAKSFFQKKLAWVKKALQRMQSKPGTLLLPSLSRRDYAKHKEAARTLVEERLRHWNGFYKLQYKRVAIRMTRSRWGSCSRQGNLNFSYRVLFLPRELLDYVIVHELCHVRELHHRKAFWALVAEAIPDYRERKSRLRLVR